MDIPVFRAVQPDLRLVGKIDLPVAANFNFSTTQPFLEGYWVKKATGVATLIGAEDTDSDTFLTYPVIASSQRIDVRQSLVLTVAFGPMLIETTRYKAGVTFSEGQQVTVRADAVGLGVLDVAASTERVFGFVYAAPVASASGLYVQLNWTGKIVA